jgi:hypothetical protein
MNKILLLLAATLIALPAADGDAAPGKGKGHHRGEMRERVLAKHDADGDGKLSEAERTAAKAACKARFAEKKAEFDADSDGKLSESERAAMRAAISARIKEKHPELFARIDADGNGEISRDEAQAARKARHERREQRGGKRGATGE